LLKKAVAVLLLISCSLVLNAEDTYFRWAKQFTGGGNMDAAQKVEVDKESNVIHRNRLQQLHGH